MTSRVGGAPRREETSMVSCLILLIFGFKLQRVCCNRRLKPGPRAWKVESSLKHSKSQTLKRLLVEDNVNIDDAVDNIMKIKSVSPEVHPQFGPVLRTCLSQICGYRRLIQDVESIRKVSYSSDNPDHEDMLLQLWERLCPDTPLEARITKQWTNIGFQGDDPMTDFRGMGILGLQNLLFFATHYTEAARKLLSHSTHPQYGYSFAIVGINMTGMAHQLLNQGHFKTHFYNVVAGRPRVHHFHHIYCYLLHEFDKFWFAEKPKDIMQFNTVKNKFQKRVIHILRDRNATLRGTLAVEIPNDRGVVTSVLI